MLLQEHQGLILRWMSLFTALVLAGCLGRSVESNAKRVSREVAQAATQLEDGHGPEALEICERLAREAEFSTLPPAARERVWTLLGLSAAATEDTEKAVSGFEKALKCFPEEPVTVVKKQVALDLARCYLEMNDGARARAALAQVAGNNGARNDVASAAKGDFSSSLLQAESYLLDGEPQHAQTILESLRGSSRAAFSLGVIHFDGGDRERALKHFEEAARLEPQEYYTGIYRARSLLELDRAEEAIGILEVQGGSTGGAGSSSQGFNTPEVFFLLGRAYIRRKRFADGARQLREAIKQRPDYTEALFSLGTSLRRLGQLDEARKVLKRFKALYRVEVSRLKKLQAQAQVVLLQPKNAMALEELARLALEAGDLQAAQRHAWRVLRLESDPGEARLTLARTLLRTGRYTAAAVHYQRFIRAHPRHSTALSELEHLVREHSRK